MIVKMLKSISDMLEVKDVQKEISIERVRCAKIMLDAIIDGMIDEKNTNTLEFIEKKHHDQKPLIPPPTPPLTPPPKRIPTPHKDEVEVVADNGIVRTIKNAKDDTMFLVDGVKLPWKNVIGMKFNSITLL